MKNIKPKLKNVNDKTLIVTVDIGKFKNFGYCRCPSGNDLKPFGFYNNGGGFNKFWDKIVQFKKQNNLKEMIVGFESTGSYGVPLIHYLKKRKVNIVQVNPMHTKRLKELQDNSPNKTDKKDPKVIADIIMLGHALSVIVPEGDAANLRNLIHARERAIQRRTSHYNQVQDLVFEIFPECYYSATKTQSLKGFFLAFSNF